MLHKIVNWLLKYNEHTLQVSEGQPLILPWSFFTKYELMLINMKRAILFYHRVIAIIMTQSFSVIIN